MDAYVIRDASTGEAVISGTGISVGMILRALATTEGIAGVLTAHPALTVDGVMAAVAFAIAAVRREVEYGSGEKGVGMVREQPVAPSYAPVGDTVFLAVGEYEDLLDRVDLLRELCAVQAEVAAGETVSNEEAREFFRSRFG